MNAIRRVIASAITCFFVACASASSAPSSGTKSTICDDASKDAREKVLKVANENRSCQADADCVNVGINASCFDACSMNLNTTAVGAVDRVAGLTEAAECAVFKDAKCPMVHPPCAPLPPPACKEGICQ